MTRRRKPAATAASVKATTTRTKAAAATGAKPSTPLRRCTKCGCRRRVTSFYKNSARADGLTIWCRPCLRSYYAARRAARREKETR